MERSILHADLNSFYASVECLMNPSFRGKPVAVGGDPESRHGIILTKNQIAKPYGIRVGQAIWEARQLCPELIVVPPHFDQYVRFSRQVRKIYEEYTDQVEPYGIDEAWLDVTGSKALFGSGEQIADGLRSRVLRETGLTISVGVSFNKIFAKLGSDLKKPDATTVIPRNSWKETVWPLPVCDLLFVGWSATKKLRDFGIYTIGDLATFPDRDALRRSMGVAGEILQAYANGQDRSSVALARDNSAIIKSVGNSTTCPRDLNDDEDVKIVLYLLAESVARRLREQGLKGKTVVISLRDNELKHWERQVPMKRHTNLCSEIAEQAFSLFKRVYSWPKPLRGIGVRVTDLIGINAPEQCFLLGEKTHQKRQALERTTDRVRRRFGMNSVQRGILLSDRYLARLDENIQSSLDRYNFLER